MSKSLREHLHSVAPELGRRADVLWNDIAAPLHERQTPPDANIGGRLHVEQVEKHIWRLITESGRLEGFSAQELFILSCAACTHDFDKGLKSCLSLLGDLWQCLGSSSSGIPYHALKRLDRSGARDALLRLLKRSGIELGPSNMLDLILDELAQVTRQESGVSSDAVYPPFLQMVASRLREVAVAGRVEQKDYAKLAKAGRSAADQIIAEFLECRLDEIPLPESWDADGDAWVQTMKDVLKTLVRSGGTKGTVSEARIAAAASTPKDRVTAVVGALDRNRLIRRRSGDQWEIIHDVLARRIVDNWLSEEDRRFKHLREQLEARARTYRQDHGLLTTAELRDLWLMRDRIPLDTLSDEERIVLFVSMFGCQLQDSLVRRYQDREDWFE